MKASFLAVLIFEDDQWVHEEPHVYAASHPEIAYRLALADGEQGRYGRRFLGLSDLEEADVDEEELLVRATAGSGAALLTPKNELAAFRDPRWRGTPWDATELSDALRGPPLLFAVEGLEEIAWHRYEHAYGAATDVPKDLRLLASSDAQLREGAKWRLEGTIYHQGSLYSATAVAVPFLVRLVSDPRLPDRGELCAFLSEIAAVSARPESARAAWAWRAERFGETYDKPCQEMADDEVAVRSAVRAALREHVDAIASLREDPDPKVREQASIMLRRLGG